MDPLEELLLIAAQLSVMRAGHSECLCQAFQALQKYARVLDTEGREEAYRTDSEDVMNAEIATFSPCVSVVGQHCGAI